MQLHRKGLPGGRTGACSRQAGRSGRQHQVFAQQQPCMRERGWRWCQAAAGSGGGRMRRSQQGRPQPCGARTTARVSSFPTAVAWRRQQRQQEQRQQLSPRGAQDACRPRRPSRSCALCPWSRNCLLTERAGPCVVQVVSSECRATVGQVSGGGRTEKPMLKAGRSYFKYKAKRNSWPKVGCWGNVTDPSCWLVPTWHPLLSKGSSSIRHRLVTL